MFKAKPKLAYAIYLIISIAFMIVFPIFIFTSNHLLGVLLGLLAAQVINFLLIGAADWKTSQSGAIVEVSKPESFLKRIQAF